MGERVYWIDEGVMPDITPNNAHWLIYMFVSGFLGKDDLVLDVGCGSGGGATILAKKCLQVHAFDYSQEAIEFARTRNARGNIEYSILNMKDFNPDLNRYDKVIAIECVEHFEDPTKEIKKFLKTLKPGGLLIMTFPVNSGTEGFHKTNFTKENIHSYLEGMAPTIRYLTAGDPPQSQNFFIMVRK